MKHKYPDEPEEDVPDVESLGVDPRGLHVIGAGEA
jgi:hypothetical protein